LSQVIVRFKRQQQIGRVEPIRFVGGRGWGVKLYRRDIIPYGVIDAPDHAALDGNSDDAGKEALGHGVSHIYPERISPLSDDVALVNDDSSRITAFLDGPDRVAERFAAEGLIVVYHQIAWRFRLASDRKVDRLLQKVGTDARF